MKKKKSAAENGEQTYSRTTAAAAAELGVGLNEKQIFVYSWFTFSTSPRLEEEILGHVGGNSSLCCRSAVSQKVYCHGGAFAPVPLNLTRRIRIALRCFLYL